MRPPDQIKLLIVRQWLEKAEEDLKAGEALLVADPPFLYPACFHAQQAAEKYLKAFLTWEQIEFPKTHMIEKLLDLLRPAHAALAAGVDGARLLTDYGVDIRYPGDQPRPTLQQAQDAITLARRVRDTILPLMPTR